MGEQPLVPLGLLALEHGTNVEHLAHRLNGEVVVDDAGLRAVPCATARRLADERQQQAEQQHASMEAWRARMAELAPPTRARLRARRERQLRLRREHPEVSAYEVAALDSGGTEQQLAAAGRRHDEYVQAGRNGGVGVMHRFNPQQNG